MIGVGVGVAVAVFGTRHLAGEGAATRGRCPRATGSVPGGAPEGLGYRMAGRGPDPEVPDDVLVDRIRSTLGGLEKRLDLPHMHVMVEDHVALLHGEVSSAADRSTIEWTVLGVPGVHGIESYLHVGLLPGGTRPSEGRARAAELPSTRCVSCSTPPATRAQPKMMRGPRSERCWRHSRSGFPMANGASSWRIFLLTSASSPGHRGARAKPSRGCAPSQSS